MSAQESLLHLSALLRLYLSQEHQPGQRLYSDRETFEYFKTYALRKKGIPPLSPPPVQKEIPQPLSPPVKTTPSSLLDKKETSLAPQKVETATLAPILQKTEFTPEPKEKKTAPKEKSFDHFVLEPMGKADPIDLSSVRKKLADLFPAMVTTDYIPDDREAKLKRFMWEKESIIPQVAVLSFNAPPKHEAFLNHLVEAIEKFGLTSKIINAHKIEEDGQWEQLLNHEDLRLTIASDYGINALPTLLKYHREVPKQAQHFLHKTPLFLLSDLSFYLKEPSLKSSLWKALKEILGPLKK